MAADIDLSSARVNAFAANEATMFDEPDLPRRTSDLLAELAREDLDKLSIAELDDRIAGLETEIARVRAKREGAAKFRAAADSLFKR